MYQTLRIFIIGYSQASLTARTKKYIPGHFRHFKLAYPYLRYGFTAVFAGQF